MSEPIIFIDIDGVLVTTYGPGRQGTKTVADPLCVDKLNFIIEETGAKLVLSSAWRYCGLQEMRKIFELWGVKGELIDVTPIISDKIIIGREVEIDQWLYINYMTKPRPAFVIIDDIKDLGMLNDYLVTTEFSEGITWDTTKKVKEVLEKQNAG